MSWEIVWTDEAVADMRRLDRIVAHRVRQAIHRLAETGYGDVKRLKGREYEWRLRVGDWRVKFTYHKSAGRMEILNVWPRKDAYRN
jgi:mRNA interferase RelE/StbE